MFVLRVGVITSTHGIRGEVKVFPTTDDPLRFKKLKKCVIDGKREQVAVTVSSVKFFKQFVILKFKEFDDINDIEKYTKCDLLVSREDAVKLELLYHHIHTGNCLCMKDYLTQSIFPVTVWKYRIQDSILLCHLFNLFHIFGIKLQLLYAAHRPPLSSRLP